MVLNLGSYWRALQREWADSSKPLPSLPHSCVAVSAEDGTGVEALRSALQELLVAADGHARHQ